MQIIKANLDRLSIAAQLFDEYRQFYRQASDLNAASDFLHERFSKNESQFFLALDEHGKGIGFVQLYPGFSSVKMKRMWILNDLYVNSASRLNGVASALIDAAKTLAIETGSVSIMLETANDNAEAQQLYRKFGFKPDKLHTYYYLDLL